MEIHPNKSACSLQTRDCKRVSGAYLQFTFILALGLLTVLQVPSIISTPQFQEPRLFGENEYSPLDVDLMDASFYLGQDQGVTSTPQNGFFTGSAGIVDFYERYWDNLMLLGNDQLQNPADMQQSGGSQPELGGTPF